MLCVGTATLWPEAGASAEPIESESEVKPLTADRSATARVKYAWVGASAASVSEHEDAGVGS